MNTETTTQEESGVLTEIKSLSLPDMAVMTRSAASSLRMAESFVITTAGDYELAGEELAAVKGRINKLEATRTSITGPINKGLSAINALFKGPMDAYKAAETKLKDSMLAYYDEQERKAAEIRRKAEEAAAAERARLAEEARQVELAAAAERQKIADAAAAVTAEAQAEQDRLNKAAADAAAAGNAAAAEEALRKSEAARQQAELQAQQAQQVQQELLETANTEAAALRMESSVVSASITHIDSAKASGTSIKGTVEYEVSNLLSLVQHVAANPALINLLMVDSVKLRAYVRGLGLNTNLPGVRVYQKRSMSAKAA